MVDGLHEAIVSVEDWEKSPDSKQPGCPEEKIKAIEEAMRHFQMI